MHFLFIKKKCNSACQGQLVNSIKCNAKYCIKRHEKSVYFLKLLVFESDEL